eukprot:PhF_6_TR15677/c1_g1_i1/m.24376
MVSMQSLAHHRHQHLQHHRVQTQPIIVHRHNHQHLHHPQRPQRQMLQQRIRQRPHRRPLMLQRQMQLRQRQRPHHRIQILLPIVQTRRLVNVEEKLWFLIEFFFVFFVWVFDFRSGFQKTNTTKKEDKKTRNLMFDTAMKENQLRFWLS